MPTEPRPTHFELALSTQAWVSRRKKAKPPAPEHFNPVTSIGRGDRSSGKPSGGEGFWTSSYDERHGSGWIQWCLSEGFDCDRDERTFPLWTLEPEPAARIYTIDSYADLEHLCRLYGRTYTFGEDSPQGPFFDTYPDWSLVAEAYDAVHMTDEGQWATRLSRPLNLYGWDCESTLWFRWAFTAVEDKGLVRCEAKDPWWEETAA